MARILQIRRGTTDANNNFTGLAGEITFDTDAKTLRVHDGVRLGGYALARADTATGGNTTNDFDITTVSDEFWENLFARFGQNGPTLLLSGQMPVKNNGFSEYIFGTTRTPISATATLVCQTPQAGYAIGDVVWAFGIGDRANVVPNVFSDGDGLHVRLMIGSQNFWVAHKDTGVITNITNSSWRIQFRVYC